MMATNKQTKKQTVNLLEKNAWKKVTKTYFSLNGGEKNMIYHW